MNSSSTIYNLRAVTHYYNDVKAFQTEALSIPAGAVTGLIGPNGSGKSTLLKLLAFAESPTEGEIYFNERKGYPFSKSVRFRVTLLTQEPYLLKRSVYDNVSYGLKIRGDTAGMTQRVKDALTDVGLSFAKFARRQWHELSGGEAQRAAMAARLILKPEVLLLDEPTANVDAESTKLIRDASLNAKDNLGTTLVIASHDWHWLYEISDTILHLYNGSVFKSGMENIITGPWERDADNGYYKQLGADQKIYVTPPPLSSSTGLIPKKDIAIHPVRKGIPSQKENQLYGKVTRMILEKSSMEIIATVMIADIFFTVRISEKKVREQALFPGSEVVLVFGRESVAWF